MNGLVGVKACLSYPPSDGLATSAATMEAMATGAGAGEGAGEGARGRPNPYEVHVDASLAKEAVRCIERMLDFTAAHPDKLAKAQHGFVKNIGAA